MIDGVSQEKVAVSEFATIVERTIADAVMGVTPTAATTVIVMGRIGGEKLSLFVPLSVNVTSIVVVTVAVASVTNVIYIRLFVCQAPVVPISVSWYAAVMSTAIWLATLKTGVNMISCVGRHSEKSRRIGSVEAPPSETEYA